MRACGGVAAEAQRSIELEIQRVKNSNQNELLRVFLADNGLPLYDEASVTAYMNRITPKYKVWHWVVAATGASLNWDSLKQHRMIAYSKPIPDVVIGTIQKVRDAWPTSVFEVTDIMEVPKGDPFLRVHLFRKDERIEQVSQSWEGYPAFFSCKPEVSFIIERWDEPGYRMTQKGVLR